MSIPPVVDISHVLACMQAGIPIEARRIALEISAREGASADLNLLLGAIHDQLGLWMEGMPYVERCIASDPSRADAAVLRARLLHRAGRSAEAIEACDQGLAKFPGHVDLLLHKAEAQEQSWQSEAALRTLGPLLNQSPLHPVAAGLAARTHHSLKNVEESLKWARRGIESPMAAPAITRGNWMQIARVLDSQGRFDEAFAAATNAHACAAVKFDRTAMTEQVESLIATFSPKNLRAFARADNRSPKPVFLIGMPRSGTSLVEQIIAAHPQACGGGEMVDITMIARSLMHETGSEYVYPDCIDDVTPAIANKFAEQYLARLAGMSAGAQRVTNKSVDQYEHLGLVWMLFPSSHVIHINRDALDTCVACYTRNLNASLMPFVTNLEDLAFVYQQNQRLMEHWKRTLDLPILTVQYEDLVANQERVTRQMIEFLGLPWDDRCLRYWEADRTVMTLSYDQVNKPVGSPGTELEFAL